MLSPNTSKFPAIIHIGCANGKLSIVYNVFITLSCLVRYALLSHFASSWEAVACHIGRVSGDHLDLQKLESIGKSCLQWDTKSMEKQSDKFNCSTLIGKHQKSTSSNWKSPTTNLGYKIQSGFRSFKNNPVEVAPAFVLLYIYTLPPGVFLPNTGKDTHNWTKHR